jgi:hypothetical protein
MVTHADEVHVVQHQRSGGWLVDAVDIQNARPWFASATEAQRAAQRHAAAHGQSRVVLHDRYHRVHAFSTRAAKR